MLRASSAGGGSSSSTAIATSSSFTTSTTTSFTTSTTTVTSSSTMSTSIGWGTVEVPDWPRTMRGAAVSADNAAAGEGSAELASMAGASSSGESCAATRRRDSARSRSVTPSCIEGSPARSAPPVPAKALRQRFTVSRSVMFARCRATAAWARTAVTTIFSSTSNGCSQRAAAESTLPIVERLPLSEKRSGPREGSSNIGMPASSGSSLLSNEYAATSTFPRSRGQTCSRIGSSSSSTMMDAEGGWVGSRGAEGGSGGRPCSK